MIKQNGYALLEVMIMLFIITSLGMIGLTNFVDIDLSHLSMANELAKNHLYALVDKEERSIYYGGDLIRFNSSGNVNGGKTIEFLNHNLVIHLGNGYFCLNEK